MRSNNTFGIQFVIRMRKQQKSDLAEVYVRITVNKCRCEIALKKKVDPNSWDEGKGQARAKSDELKKLNNHLELVRSQIAECYHELDRQKKAVTAEGLKFST
ncbi:MAG: Arm DNA-binding domain-containing protein [Daejeonella sp.]